MDKGHLTDGDGVVVGQHFCVDLLEVGVQFWPIGVVGVAGLIWGVRVCDVSVWETFRLADEVYDIHPKAADAALEPEAQDAVDGVADGGVRPIEIRLFGGEEGKEVLLCLLVPGPGTIGFA